MGLGARRASRMSREFGLFDGLMYNIGVMNDKNLGPDCTYLL